LPLAEALAHGKLCVSSNAGGLSEIGGELVIRIDPKDTMAWSRAISKYLASQSDIDELEARVQMNYRPTTWDEAANIFFSAVTDATFSPQRFDIKERESEL